MRVVVTRPQGDADRIASLLRHRGHEVLIAPLMRAEPIAADLCGTSGTWSAVIITSARAPGAISGNRARKALLDLPLFAVGRRSAQAATEAGFRNVHSAGGEVHDLVRLIAERHAGVIAPVLYLAGQERAADLIGELSKRGIQAQMRVVYRMVNVPFPSELVEALTAGEVDEVLHFSKRSAENYLAGATAVGIAAQALAVRHVCLSDQVARPLAAAGASSLAIAARPEEAALIELLARAPG